jgi:lipooligosaccharide transport system ATP-binding protein
VVEVYGEGLNAWRTCAEGLCRRCETAGETLFCYVDDPAPTIAELEKQSGLRYLHRPANLEDVFLKLTGRDLRD